MQFRLIPAFTRSVHECQRFREHRQSYLWLSQGAMSVGEERQVIRSCYLCPGGTQGAQTLLEVLDPVLRLSLVCQRPAVQHSTSRPQLRKSLFLRQAHRGFGAFLGATLLAAQLMEDRCTT